MNIKINPGYTKIMSQINYLQYEFIESTYNSFTNLKDKLSSDILNFELSVLYCGRIYDKDAELVRNITGALSESIDDILNEHHRNVLQSIEELFDKMYLDLERVQSS